METQKTKLKLVPGGFSSFSVIAVFMLLSLVGFALLSRLDIRLLPSKKMPTIYVTYFWHNVSARIIENRVTAELEGLFSGLSNVREINSFSALGKGLITIEFEKSTNLDLARFYVSTLVRRAFPKFPHGVSYPQVEIRHQSEQGQALLSYSLYGNLTSRQLFYYAENVLKPQLSHIQGVSKIDFYGLEPNEFFIIVDNSKQQNFGISAADMKEAVHAYFAQYNLGVSTLIVGENSEIQVGVRVNNHASSDIDWSKIPIKVVGDRIIYLTDVAKVEYRTAKPTSFYRINGLNTVAFTIYPVANINTLNLANKIKQQIAEIELSFPKNLSLENTYDSTVFVKSELEKVSQRTLMAMLVLFLFVFLVSLSVRYLAVIIISLAVNLAMAVAVYYLFKIEIHIYSLAGIAISVGIIMDNAIVMIDHIRHQKNLRSFMSVLAATLTTVGALSVILFLRPENQANVVDFSVVVIINLAISLLVSLFLVPALLEQIRLKKIESQLMFRRNRRVLRFNKTYSQVIHFQLKYKWIPVLCIILFFGFPVYDLPEKLESDTHCSQIYNATLGTKFYQNHIKPIADIVLGGTLRVFSRYVWGESQDAEPGRTILYINARMPEGHSVEQLDEMMRRVEAFLGKYPQIELFTTNITNYKSGNISVYFKPEYERGSFPHVLKGEVSAFVNNIDGMDWSVSGVGIGFNNSVNQGFNTSHIYLFGYDYDQLYAIAKKVYDELEATKRVKDLTIKGQAGFVVEPPREKLVASIDAATLAGLNISPLAVYSSLSEAAFSTIPLTNIFLDNQSITVNLEQGKAGFDSWAVMNTPMAMDGNVFKLKGFTTVVKEPTEHDIYKRNQNYQIVLGYNFLGTTRMEHQFTLDKVSEINSWLPLGYRATVPTYGFSKNESDNNQLIFVVIVVIFFILSILFESLRQPFTVLSLIPIAFSGAFLTFYLFRINFDHGGYASFVLLAGITINSALYIVNEYNNIVNQKQTRGLKNYIKAYNRKIIPILLTVLSTILGLIPFVVIGKHEPFWYAFAVGSISGLIFSLFGLVFLFPAIFLRPIYKDQKSGQYECKGIIQ